MIKPLFETSRTWKRLMTVAYDAIGIIGAIYGALALRLGEFYVVLGKAELASIMVTMLVTLFCFVRLGLYRAILRYMTLPALSMIMLGVVISGTVLIATSYFFHSFIPRSVPIIYVALAMFVLGCPRILARSLFYHYYRRKKPNVVIYGAGVAGCELAYALIQGNRYHPVAFIDDNPTKWRSIQHGIRVYGPDALPMLIGRYEPVKLLLAIHNLEHAARQRLVQRLEPFRIEVQSVPSIEELTSGRSNIEEVKDLDIVDLLGRKPVPPIEALMACCIADKTVMVTGAGGSIGSELCRQIARHGPSTLLLFELNEYNLYSIERELRQNYPDIELVAVLGSIQKKARLERLMTTYQVNTVYHAAAYKHVPMVEHNIVEGLRNNVFGTWFAAEAAIKAGVDNFVLISTDKAVRPTNVMGATKRLAELVLQALAQRQTDTCFSMVRFGNVLGSSGSVVPLFREQIRKGGPVTITHPDITRYFMTIPEAAQLVIQAGAMGISGQVFLLDMGEPVKILELAQKMIVLSGKTIRSDADPDGDIAISYTGLRAGEKLFEELLISGEVVGTEHPRIMAAFERKMTWAELEDQLTTLDAACRSSDVKQIWCSLQALPLDFQPTGEIVDTFWQKRERVYPFPELGRRA